MEYISIDAEVMHRGKPYPYKFIYFPNENNNVIDFKESRFYIGQAGGWSDNISFNDYQDYLNMNKYLIENNREALKSGGILKNIYIRELHLNKALIEKDLFRITIMVAFIISQPLKKAIEGLKISGVAISPVEGYKKQVWDYSVNPPREVI